MKKLISMMFVLLLMPMMLVSCLSDSDETTTGTATYPMQLLGVWDGVSMYADDSAANDKTDGDKSDSSEVDAKAATEEAELDITNVRLAIDYMGYVYVWTRENENSEYKENTFGVWVYSDDTLRMQFKKDDTSMTEIFTAKVKALSEKSMTLVFEKEVESINSAVVKKEYTTVVFNRYENTTGGLS